jgi:putative transposase
MKLKARRSPLGLTKFSNKSANLTSEVYGIVSLVKFTKEVRLSMLVFEAKLEGTPEQYSVLDEVIRTARFIRNSCLRYWMDNRGVGRNEISAYTAILAQQFEFAGKLNSMARQASGERAWAAIARFYDNCKKQKPGKKEYPRFKKHQTHGSVEYKTTGWKLSDDRRYISFIDGFKAGTFKMWGTRDLHFYQLKQIKRG